MLYSTVHTLHIAFCPVYALYLGLLLYHAHHFVPCCSILYVDAIILHYPANDPLSCCSILHATHYHASLAYSVLLPGLGSKHHILPAAVSITTSWPAAVSYTPPGGCSGPAAERSSLLYNLVKRKRYISSRPPF